MNNTQKANETFVKRNGRGICYNFNFINGVPSILVYTFVYVMADDMIYTNLFNVYRARVSILDGAKVYSSLFWILVR